MEYPSKAAFRAEFQRRLLAYRTETGLEQEDMAKGLGISTAAYQKYETRSISHFPLYLLPRLVAFTEKPYSYWCTGLEVARKGLHLVT